MPKNSYHVIAVNDLTRSLAYYRDVLGFEIKEIGDAGWRFFVRGDVTIMAGDCPDAIPPGETGDHSYFAYMIEDDIDTYFDAVNSAGAEILKSVRDEPWGMREFALRTADGHRIMFGKPIGKTS